MRISNSLAGVAAALAVSGTVLMGLQGGAASATTQLKPPLITEAFGNPLPCDPNTTIGQEGCGEHKVLAADKQLNADIRFLFGRSGGDRAQRDFVTAQLDWATFRRAECTSESDVYLGGTEQPVVFIYCLATQDSARRQQLKTDYELDAQGLTHPPKFP